MHIAHIYIYAQTSKLLAGYLSLAMNWGWSIIGFTAHYPSFLKHEWPGNPENGRLWVGKSSNLPHEFVCKQHINQYPLVNVNKKLWTITTYSG